MRRLLATIAFAGLACLAAMPCHATKGMAFNGVDQYFERAKGVWIVDIVRKTGLEPHTGPVFEARIVQTLKGNPTRGTLSVLGTFHDLVPDRRYLFFGFNWVPDVAAWMDNGTISPVPIAPTISLADLESRPPKDRIALILSARSQEIDDAVNRLRDEREALDRSVGRGRPPMPLAPGDAWPALLPDLLSTDTTRSARAHIELQECGERLLPALIKEMNKPEYLADPVNPIAKLGDPRWIRRMALARLIQDIAHEDFAANTTAHGWRPDYSFDLINAWWREKGATAAGGPASRQGAGPSSATAALRQAFLADLPVDVHGAGHILMELAASTADVDAKWRAIRALGDLRYAQAVPLFTACLQDEQPSVRACAARALGDQKAASAAPALLKVLETETDGGVIEQTSLALRRLQVREAVPLLKRLAGHESGQTRIWVLQAIGDLGSRADVPFLAARLDAKDLLERDMAARAIQDLVGTDFAFPQLGGPYNPEAAIGRAQDWWRKHQAEFEER